MQLTGGNFVGLVLSAVQMVVGFFFLMVNADAGTKTLVAVIGVALAVLIERLTLGGLIAIRVSNESIHYLEETHFQTLQIEQRQETPLERTNLDRRVKKLKSDRRMSIPVASVGMLLSTSIGDIFWHHLFESLGGFLAFVLGFACAGVIGLTFVYSELYKAIMDNTLGEIISDQVLMGKAVKAEEQNMQMDVMVDSYDAIRNDETKLEPAKTKVEETIVSRLSAFADAVANAGLLPNGNTLPNGQTAIDAPLEQKRLPAPNGRGRYRECKDELAKLRQQRTPRMSMQDLANHFKIAKSTVSDWIDRLETEQAAEQANEQSDGQDERLTNKGDGPTPIADKLDKTVAALSQNPDMTDEELAMLLDLKRPASARFWRLKAKEIIVSRKAV